MSILHGRDHDGDLTLDTDVVVIGSGAGGAVATMPGSQLLVTASELVSNRAVRADGGVLNLSHWPEQIAPSETVIIINKA